MDEFRILEMLSYIWVVSAAFIVILILALYLNGTL